MTWVNIEKPTPDDVKYLREHYSFHPLDLEDCLSRIERPKIDEYDDYHVVFRSANHAEKVDSGQMDASV